MRKIKEILRLHSLGLSQRQIAISCAVGQELGAHLREELYYRLSVFQIVVPPLREHKEDIPPIADVMMQNLNKKHDTRVTGVDGEVMNLLHRYDWPGNVRELRNVLERAAIMAGAGLIRPTHLPAPAFAEGSGPYTRPPSGYQGPITLQPGQPLAKIEETYIKLTLEHVHSNRRLAADQLGISLRTLQNRIAGLRD